MAKDITIKDFEEINLYSNKNIETVCRMLVNESSNAVLVNMFEDAVILLDHTEGQFYMADYKYDKEKFTFIFENFEPIRLETDNQEFKESVYDFFDAEEPDANAILESYKDSVSGQNGYVSELISECMAYKDWSKNVDYNEIENDPSIVNESFVQKYIAEMDKNPSGNIKYFNWKDPVKVCINEDEGKKIISKEAIVASADLWKNKEFKTKFIEISKVFVEDVENGSELMTEFFNKYPQLLMSEFADIKAVLGKALIGSEIKEHMSDVLAGVKILLEKFDLQELKQQKLDEGYDPENINEEDEELNLSPEQIDKLVGALNVIWENTESDSVKQKITSLVEEIEEMKTSGVNPAVVKDAVSIITIKV